MRIIAVIMLLLVCGVVQAEVLITEVYFDPKGTENGGEFVELFNNGDTTVSISEWVLSTKSSVKDVTLPSEAHILPGSYYLVTDTGWEKRDDLNWDESDYAEAITLANDDGFVSLLDGEKIVDTVTWGEDAVDVRESLQRKLDNGSYTNTFEALSPDPRNSSTVQSDGLLLISVEVEAYTLSLYNFTIDDDLFSEGIQVSPVPGKKRSVFVNITLGGNDVITSVKMDIFNSTVLLEGATLNDSHSQYTGTFSFWYHQLPGEYNITITATGKHTTLPLQFAVTVLPLAGIFLDTSAISVQKARPGEEVFIKGDEKVSTTDSPTIKNIGNIPLDLSVRAKNVSEGRSFSDTLFSFNGIDFSSASQNLLKNINLGLDATIPLSLKFIIPQNATSGLYTTALAIQAIGR
jgi:hypothetical protein|tara:strand:+ start:94 stop:1308 length:1215 start_codon:yes stop_codon:yes gene_type:complete